MVIKNSRAQRRHDYARLKDKRKTHWGYGHNGHRSVDVMPASAAGMVVNTPTPCSCYMCGNPRRSRWAENPLTIQEQKATEAYEASIEEYQLTHEYYYDYDYFLSLSEMALYDEYDPFENNPADDWYLRWMYIK